MFFAFVKRLVLVVVTFSLFSFGFSNHVVAKEIQGADAKSLFGVMEQLEFGGDSSNRSRGFYLKNVNCQIANDGGGTLEYSCGFQNVTGEFPEIDTQGLKASNLFAAMVVSADLNLQKLSGMAFVEAKLIRCAMVVDGDDRRDSAQWNCIVE